MGKQKYVEINGKTFELCKWAQDPPTWAHVQNTRPRYNDLSDAYGHCSVRKKAIWKAWKVWSAEMPCKIWIESKTWNFFSIAGFCECQGKRYWVYITYAHNRAYEVER